LGIFIRVSCVHQGPGPTKAPPGDIPSGEGGGGGAPLACQALTVKRSWLRGSLRGCPTTWGKPARCTPAPGRTGARSSSGQGRAARRPRPGFRSRRTGWRGRCCAARRGRGSRPRLPHGPRPSGGRRVDRGHHGWCRGRARRWWG